MGNIIFPFDDNNEVKTKEIHISVSSIHHENTLKKKENKLHLFINSLQKFYINYFLRRLKIYKKEEHQIITDKNNLLLIKNPPESNQSNVDNLTLNSSILKKDVEDDTQIIDSNKISNNINHIQNKQKNKNETPDGDGNIIIEQREGSPPKIEEPKPQNKNEPIRSLDYRFISNPKNECIPVTMNFFDYFPYLDMKYLVGVAGRNYPSGENLMVFLNEHLKLSAEA